jgi:hypothetical protein
VVKAAARAAALVADHNHQHHSARNTANGGKNVGFRTGGGSDDALFDQEDTCVIMTHPRLGLCWGLKP